MTAVGIDFGTTNSVVAQYASGDVEVIKIDDAKSAEWDNAGFGNVFPSVFALDEQREALFGWQAKLNGQHSIPAVKRLFASTDVVELAEERFFVEEIAALLFSRMRAAALGQGVEFSRAVVTVPANSRGLARYRTKISAGMAGIEVPALINEPTAAAMAFGLRAADDQRILVVDWGGGTLDVTLLDVQSGIFIEHTSKGKQRCGGIEFDQEIKRRLASDDPNRDSWTAAEHRRLDLDIELAKIRLTNSETTSVELPRGQRRDLSRKKVEEWVRPRVEQVKEPVETCLGDAHMTSSGLDHVLLVGGTCMMPAVRNFISDLLEREPAKGAEPLTAIAKGAAITAAILAGEHDSEFFVSTEHALGTVALGDHGLEFSEIIPRNHKLPARSTSRYVPVHDFQESIQMTVIEGDPKKPLDHEDNVVLREWDLKLEPRPKSETSLGITYEYDVDGILHVSVVDVPSQRELLSGDVSFAGKHEPRELVEMSQRVDAIVDDAASPQPPQPGIPPDVATVVDRARVKVIPFVPDEEAERLSQLAADLEAAATSGDFGEAKETLEGALRKYAYLY